MRRSGIRQALALGTLAVALAGCGGDDVGLSAQTWTLVEVGGEAAVATAVATLTFAEDGTLSGNSGCNSFTTSYEVDGSALIVTQPVAATLRECDAPVMNQEAAILAALAATTEFSVSGSELVLIDQTGDALATYSAES